MKVLLIQPPNTQIIRTAYPNDYDAKARSSLPPLGLLYLSGYLKKRHDVKVVDMILSDYTDKDLQYIIENFNPDMVGLPAIIGLWASTIKILRQIKSLDPEIYTVVGGPNTTQYPAETLCNKEIDFLIMGSGQKPLMALCDQLDSGGDGSGIDNCYLQKESYEQFNIVFTKEYEIDNFPFPDRRAVPFIEYIVPFCPDNPTTTMITSMGCPFKCAFCSTNRPPVQYRSTESIINEMEEIAGMGIKSILFQDELFNLNRKRVEETCDELIERNIGLHWSIKSRIDTTKSWMPELMKKAGCFNVHFGIESGNDATLKRMKKGYTSEQISSTIKYVKDAGLSCTANFMLAYPGETEEDIYQNIKFAQELDLDLVQYSLTLDAPGSELFNEAQKGNRRIEDNWRKFTRNPDNIELMEEQFSALDSFSSEQLTGFLKEAYANSRTLYDIT